MMVADSKVLKDAQSLGNVGIHRISLETFVLELTVRSGFLNTHATCRIVTGYKLIKLNLRILLNEWEGVRIVVHLP